MNTTSPYKTIIRFEQAAEQADGPIKRVIGFVPARNILSLFDDATLDANPRSAKANGVVADIIGSVRDTPEIFQFKTKGILLGTSDFTELDRKRYELNFADPAYEGLLDGGHNMLALGTFILSHVMDEKEVKKLKLWEDMKAAWLAHRDEVYAMRDQFNFKVPVELLLPSNPDDEGTVNDFRLALIEICAARNNNAQLTTEAKANQRGFYEEIRKRMPKYLADRIEWKTNEWGSDDNRPIKARDLIALAWIPLTNLSDAGLLPTQTEKGSPLNFSVLPQNIYRNKGELSMLFDKLMEHPAVSKQKNGPQYEMHNPAIGSAFDVLSVLPALYDKIFVEMGDAYNKSTNGKFGKISAVKVPKKGSAYSPFTQQPSKFGVPDGFVLPILYGLKALMEISDGKIRWLTDPEAFLDRHMKILVGAFKMPMEMAGFDPQKVAKSENSYLFMVGEFEKQLIKEQAAE
ncbi:hypothetical protein [Bradyrhizobium sp. CCBAU 53421]|uniref:hypothetical protein n=1 Tax=Bradyrhizobium sp. CCBAU 53421 TaxID=1325120 RepID=UPI00188AE963|nr:hypothetical protein [Bradyrhizobium sp. CCBAU 53421]QOZ32505.1 hypothetical protein XH92_13015 [Bradyrhizobium sp. CCBAU 53421]